MVGKKASSKLPPVSLSDSLSLDNGYTFKFTLAQRDNGFQIQLQIQLQIQKKLGTKILGGQKKLGSKNVGVKKVGVKKSWGQKFVR